MNKITDKLDNLTHTQLKGIIQWTLLDLRNAAKSPNYASLDDKVKNWCSMLEEAVKYQIDKAYNKTMKEEE